MDFRATDLAKFAQHSHRRRKCGLRRHTLWTIDLPRRGRWTRAVAKEFKRRLRREKRRRLGIQRIGAHRWRPSDLYARRPEKDDGCPQQAHGRADLEGAAPR